MPKHTNDFTDVFFNGDDFDHAAVDPWSVEGRTNTLMAARQFFEAMPVGDHKKWSFMTAFSEQDWYLPEDLPPNAVRKMFRRMSRAWDKPGTAEIPAIFFADLIVRPNPFEDKNGAPGILVHAHGLPKIAPSDKVTQAQVRENFAKKARGRSDLQFNAFREKQGGLFGLFGRQYFMKDWRNPMKPDPRNSRRRLPCNDRFTTFMNRYIAENELRPDDFVLLKNLRRFGNVIRPAPSLTRSR